MKNNNFAIVFHELNIKNRLNVNNKKACPEITFRTSLYLYCATNAGMTLLIFNNGSFERWDNDRVTAPSIIALTALLNVTAASSLNPLAINFV